MFKWYRWYSSTVFSTLQVYAISSQDGHIIYHVNNPKPISKQSNHNHPGATTDASITTMTSLTQQGGSGAKTSKASNMAPRGERDVDAEKVNPEDVTITRNPFESHNSIEHVSVLSCVITISVELGYYEFFFWQVGAWIRISHLIDAFKQNWKFGRRNEWYLYLLDIITLSWYKYLLT